MKLVHCDIHRDTHIVSPSTIEEFENKEYRKNSIDAHLIKHPNEGCKIITIWFQKVKDYDGN